MIEQMTYIADDGTVFYEEEECRIHEWKNKIDDMKSRDLLILDCDKQPCYFNPADAHYVLAKTNEAVAVLIDIFDYYDMGLPWWNKIWADEGLTSDHTMWVRDEQSDCWYSYVYLERLRLETINTCEDVKQIMGMA